MKHGKPPSPQTAARLQEALAAHGQGRLDFAEAGYRAVLAVDAGDGNAANLLGVLLHQTGRNDEALALVDRALRALPTFADAHSNRGMVLLAMGRDDEALAALGRAIALRPGHWNALGMRAEIHRRTGRWSDAAADLAAALAGNPGWADGWLRLTRLEAQRARWPVAIEAAMRAVALVPGNADCLLELGSLQRRAGEPDAALQSLAAAAARAPGDARIALEQGLAYFDRGHYVRALEAFAQARAAAAAAGLEVVHADALAGLGSSWGRIGCPDEALEALDAASRIDPDRTDVQTGLLAALCYSPRVGKAERFRRHREWAERAERRAVAEVPAEAPVPSAAKALRAGPPWRIGLLSADLRNHAVARFLLPWLPHLDRSRFELHAYSLREDREVGTDAIAGELRRHFAGWRGIAELSDAALRRQVGDDGIDVLVDLAGHTAPNRLPAFAIRMAPVQATWLGYPETTGLSTIDYRLTDRVCDPHGEEAFASERLVRLDAGLSCYAPVGEERDATIRAPMGGAVTFGCLNNLSKLTPEVLAVYAAILSALPASELLLKSIALEDPAVREQILSHFIRAGVDAARVRICGPTVTMREHLETYNRIDLALDSFPFNGATTTCEALWMGVPVLTLRGDRHAGRVAESVIRRVFGEDAGPWVADDARDFIARAVCLGGNGRRTAAQRSALRARTEASPLMDGATFAREFERTVAGWIAAARAATVDGTAR
jgi:tetratricopeptide (TPR) repeat protein